MFGGMLPPPARKLVVRWLGQWRKRQAHRSFLNATPEPCDVGRLGRVDQAWLKQALTAPSVDAEWLSVEEELGDFEITTSAGGVNPGDRRALYYLVRALRPERVLEIGTHIGASTVHVAAAVRANASEGGPAPDVTTVDIEDVNDPVTQPWMMNGSQHSPAVMIARMGMPDAVHFVTQPSLDYLSVPGDDFSLIFLDGDHSAATVYRELPAALRRLRPGGLVLLHDYFPEGKPLWPGSAAISGPWLGVNRLRREGAGLEVLPLADLPWPTKLGTNVTSLALVSRSG
jgi:predicted O-methyltransferase YrrM